MPTARRHISLVLVLLGLFVSYNLDLECVLNNDSHCAVVSCHDVTADDVCAEPSFSSPPVVAIVIRDFQLEPRATEQTTDYSAILSSHSSTVDDPRLKIPIGLRAPPVSVS